MRKKLLIGLTAVAIAGLALTGCSSRAASESADSTVKKGDTIGVALPAKTSQNWVLAKASFEKALKGAGFKSDVQYSASVSDQQNVIQSMVTKGDKVIVIAAQDGSQLGTQVAQAKKAGATVIAWDRNIMNTKNVDYYAAFNNYKVGQLQAQALLDGMKAKKASGPYNIELFAGANTDANASVFFNGAMSVLKPLIDKGELKVPSGQTTFQQVQTDNWDPKNSQTRMTNIITKTYSNGTVLDGVLSPNDTLGRSIITAAQQAGLAVPIVTGQDSETASIPLIMNGTQYSTIYKNTDDEAKAAVELITDLSKGDKKPAGVDFNDKTNAYNGQITVPYKALTPVLVTKDNAVDAYSNNPTLEALAKGAK
ncbi:sugar-binding protein [Planctomonas sp. JC2975]|uniref:substrate-binding domain-containing protein n=1 Tax=Planctomonas sp. JC2975 TaxID=2729626 RepID=UPI0014735AD2|nr:sugar-binding protein [Planctomonas sp. JC2975]NNC12698.1 sugar-binding protein [Planctomonas sp. JC2975]